MKNKAFDTPIGSIEQAKEYFRSMGCSHFHMAREFPERYNEYKKLNIPQQTELTWRIERFDEIYSAIMENKNNERLWWLHSELYDLYRDIKTDNELIKILEATKHIRNKVPMRERVIVAETINGRPTGLKTTRQARSGLIYMSYDLGNIIAAKEFVELSLHFSNPNSLELIGMRVRCQKSIYLCLDIKNELGL